MKSILFVTFLAVVSQSYGQGELPYREIPDYPPTYTAGTVAARVLDGLGFRYYWATEGLRPEDLGFQANKDGRTTLETITHIHDLTWTIINAARSQPNDNTVAKPTLSFEEMRKKTLENIRDASEILKKATDKQVSELKVIFKNEKGITEFPFWNELNGPIADALWHTGQVVSYRRGSGNPYNAKASVFTGKVRQ
ncbi:MAG: hypothetical protein JST14_02470 [Bacteroidetes bacterium]|nr:hypothetical protein [Bacteroidota bacterium]MBS1978567.1 hypothetical protein [Bacteroidota bacterium]